MNLIKSYAKINLFLKILGVKDSFHELETALAFIDLYDEISVNKSEKFSIKIDGEFSRNLDEENNLLTKIADFFSQEFKIKINLEVKLTKNIPLGSGLGGGSSNAANFMKILNDFYKLNLSKEELQKISFNFGSDIAFFFEDKSSLIRNRGQVEENLSEFSDLEILLVNPKIPLSTKDVFDKYHDLIKRKKLNYSIKSLNENIINKDIFELIDLQNDLTKPAISLSKEVGDILQNLKNLGASQIKMSGSGSTCFGVFEKDKIEEAKKELENKFANYLIRKTKILYKI